MTSNARPPANARTILFHFMASMILVEIYAGAWGAGCRVEPAVQISVLSVVHQGPCRKQTASECRGDFTKKDTKKARSVCRDRRDPELRFISP